VNLFQHLTCTVIDKHGFKPADGMLKQVQHDRFWL